MRSSKHNKKKLIVDNKETTDQTHFRMSKGILQNSFYETQTKNCGIN